MRTFQTYLAFGLLKDGNHWDKTLEEAAISVYPTKLRELFLIMLVFCQLSNPAYLWEKYKRSLSEDIAEQMATAIEPEIPSVMEHVFDTCLTQISDLVQDIGGHKISYYGISEA